MGPMLHAVQRHQAARLAVAVIVVLTLTAGECQPSDPQRANISEFVINPVICCEGEQVTLRWRATGTSATIESNPPGLGLGTVGVSDSRTVRVRESTTFQLNVQGSGGSTATASVPVTTFRNGQSFSIGGLSTCDRTSGRYVVTATYASSTLSMNMGGGLVVPEAVDRPGLVVVKDGQQVAVPGNLGGEPIAGAWTLSVPLRDNDICPGEETQLTTGAGNPPPPAPSPPFISVAVEIVCRGG